MNRNSIITCQGAGISSARSTAPEGALVREVPPAGEPAQSAPKERQCVRYHQSKEREESTTKQQLRETSLKWRKKDSTNPV